MSQNIKLTGTSSFSHPSFVSAPGGDIVHIKKGDVIKVTDDVAERLLDRSQKISDEDVRYTFTATDEKAKYNFAGEEHAAVTQRTATVKKTDDETPPPPKKDAKKPAAAGAAQRRGRTS